MEKSVLRGLVVDGLVAGLLESDWGTPEFVESFARDFYRDSLGMDPTAIPILGGTYEELFETISFVYHTYPLIDILVGVLGAGLKRHGTYNK